MAMRSGEYSVVKELETTRAESYRYRRLYEEVARQMTNLYKWADEHGIDLPSPGDSGGS